MKLPLLFITSITISLGYLLGSWVQIKTLTIWSLSAMTWAGQDSYSRWIASGLLLSSFGDIFLELDDHNPTENYFIFGLLAFLIAHLMYIRAFLCSNVSYERAAEAFVPVFGYYCAINYVLIPNVETAMIVPVLVYGMAISTMVFLAILRFTSPSTCGGASRYCSLIGSVVFLVSDSILAVNRFAYPVPDVHFYVLVTYYVGQTYIAASACSNAKKAA